MIRLNCANKPRINEKDINCYSPQHNMGLPIITMVICGDIENLLYKNEQERDKDIELLDKLFDVKPIEDKANAYPDEIDVFNYAMSGIKQECELVKEEYLTWNDVCQLGSVIALLSSGEHVKCTYVPQTNVIRFKSVVTNRDDGYIADEDLFNALMLKRVE